MKRLSLMLLLATGCGGSSDALTLQFLDELVEAPARTAQIAISDDSSCPTLLAVPHSDLEDVAHVVERRVASYPLDPKLDVFEAAPRGQALAIDVSVLDSNALQISRGCVEATLNPTAQTDVLVELHGLAPCVEAPIALDVGLVMDTSTGMRDANIGLENALIDKVKFFVENLGVPGGVRFTVITHGHTPPQEHLPATGDRTAVLAALEELRDVAGGDATHYPALGLGASLLRSRAVCGRRPVLVWIGGGPDASAPASFEIASIEVVGTRGESFDDLYVYAIGISAEAVGAMRALVDVVELGEIEGALTQARLTEALSNAHFRLQGLVEP